MAVDSPTQEFKNPVTTAAAFGRLFWAGGSTVYFSQVLRTTKTAGFCYQLNDPISEEIPDLLDTDGGYIFLDGAQGIRTMTPFRTGVLVFAENGVWYIYNPDGGFKATAFNISKITERGITDIRSVVAVDGSVWYISDNGMMRIDANEFDNLTASDISESTIKSYLIENHVGKGVIGTYDPKEKQVWWINKSDGKVLVYDVTAEAFYPQENASDNRYGLSIPFYRNNTFEFTAWSDTTNVLEFGICGLTDAQFKDFGVDQEAYMVTGPETLGKFSHSKSIVEGKAYFNKTETQILGFDGSNYIYDLPSSCLFQARWDFDVSNAYAKWVGTTPDAPGSGIQIQLYNSGRRGFIPSSYPFTINNGEGVIKKKFNIRGSGDAVQFRFEAEPEKDLQLLGYSVNYSMAGKM